MPETEIQFQASQLRSFESDWGNCKLEALSRYNRPRPDR